MTIENEPFCLGIHSDNKKIELPEVAENISIYLAEHKIKPYSKEYLTFRKLCSEQMESIPRDVVMDLAKILLADYDLRVLSYELIYYYGFDNN